MKITIETLADFLSELQHDYSRVHDGTIRLRKISTPTNEIVNEISYTVTALIVDDDANGHLIRYARDCGNDVSGDNGDTDASTAMNDDVELLDEVCGKCNLHIRPGEIEL